MTRTGFGAVVQFEIVRTFRKPQFWIAAILLPVLFGVIGLVVAWSSAASSEASSSQSLDFDYVAPPGLISEQVAAAHHGSLMSDEAAGIERVKDGLLDAFFVYSGKSPGYEVAIYAQDRGSSSMAPTRS
ncbi:hypothetical protein GCM10025867_43950 [Frondihabitans sucicola]|uniref:ABC transporter permease n=1 Tax=Frondihabitans sucicola TaxID=1268041 RepID=A0ABM8GUK2_9MICO|nr:hypothetical protein [Frondihabitans sucicola]BDZ52154.1 hypothetical protein GCM10025867_43950 [Frondihabitans sucicola]